MHTELSRLMRQCLEATVGELSEEFRGVFSRETVARYVESSSEDIGDRPTVGPNFLPVSKRPVRTRPAVGRGAG